jgi:predicted  nucleic acid-binding Zn-ribbon protein
MYELFCRSCGTIFKSRKINLGCPNCGRTLFDVRSVTAPEPKPAPAPKPVKQSKPNKPAPEPQPEPEPIKENTPDET